jgi:Na+-transporting NADH:ubiquinone oxidoreductase subunit C
MERSNSYIVLFAAAVCLVCSVFVAFSAVALKERQDVNAVLDRQTKVLIVAGLVEEKAKISAAEVQSLFDEWVVPRVVDLETGAYDDSIDAATYDQQRALKDPAMSRPAPENRAGLRKVPLRALVYQVMDDEGQVEKIILPVEGKGLWSTLYGFLALAPDTTSITGITFYQHGETPGLGGEVDNPSWKALWPGRRAFDEEWKPAIQVIKGSAGPPTEDPYRVDGLSGATLTARGVNELVRYWLGEEGFGPYLERFRSERSAA